MRLPVYDIDKRYIHVTKVSKRVIFLLKGFQSYAFIYSIIIIRRLDHLGTHKGTQTNTIRSNFTIFFPETKQLGQTSIEKKVTRFGVKVHIVIYSVI